MLDIEEELNKAVTAAYLQGLREGLIQSVNVLENFITEVEAAEGFEPPRS